MIDKQEIEYNVKEWASKHLGAFEFRQYQFEYIVSTLESILGGTQVNLIEAPTGSGKSVMVLIMAGVLFEYYHKRSYILCSDTYLWQQYENVINKFQLTKFGKLKGTYNNYTCDLTDEDFSLAPCRLANISYKQLSIEGWCYSHHWECALTCEYIQQRIRAIKSPVTVLTYQLWLQYMNKVNTEEFESVHVSKRDFPGENTSEESAFPPRDVVFCDECHKVPEICQEFNSLDVVKHRNADKLREMIQFCIDEEFVLDDGMPAKNIKVDQYIDELNDAADKLFVVERERPEEVLGALSNYFEKIDEISIAYKCYSQILETYKNIGDRNKGPLGYVSKREFKALSIAKWFGTYYYNIRSYLKLFEPDQYATGEEKIQYVVKSDNRYYDEVLRKKVWPSEPQAIYKFAKEDILVYKSLLRHQSSTVMLSATIGNQDSFDDNIGVKYANDKKSKMFVIPSTFDFSKSPIYYIPGNKMSKEFINDSFPVNAKIVNSILSSSKHANEKGIIHTGSYKNAYDLLNMLDKENKKRVFIYSTAKEKKEILEKFQQSKNGVLVGPTLTEGIDLPNDGCRFIVIFKIPYPYLGDELIRAKIVLFPKWYNSETSRSVIQGIGRGNRTPDDWSTTYILDGSFTNLYQETRNQYSKEMKERIKILNNK